MSNPVVKCTVDKCTHYMPGDQCMAGKIGIYNDETTGKSSNSADTQCKSFHHNMGFVDMVSAIPNSNISGAVKAAFLDGKQITPSVECYVNNCQHWTGGNFCNAQEISVAGSNASKTLDTDCQTFSAK